jgi:hypothetical protein
LFLKSINSDILNTQKETFVKKKLGKKLGRTFHILGKIFHTADGVNLSKWWDFLIEWR